MIERCVEMLIREAVQRGEFERLRGAGKKIDLTTYFDTPAQSRLAYSVLASAGVVPREVELLREIAGLETAGDSAETVDSRGLVGRYAWLG
jgi:hypothetical protein